MQIRTPEISWFARKAIMSLDFQQNALGKMVDGGYRLATSAIPDNEQFIRLWKVGFESSSTSSNIDITYLCGLNYHETVVNAVKFSPCDPYLAAADSDGLVVVWKLEDTPAIPDIFSDTRDDDDDEDETDTPLETWKPWRKFRDHLPRKDVLDVCWSPDGKRLVSCGLDRSVLVWDVEGNKRLILINEHESRHPMGVAYDPQSEYLVTLSNARAMCVYDGTRYQRLYTVTKASVPSLQDPEKQIVSKIFHDVDTLFSFSRRLCFSPCGELLFAPAGAIEEGSTIMNVTYIFTRHQLTKPAVALTSATEIPFAVRCCPLVFELRSLDEPSVFDLPYRIVFAVLTKASVIFYDTQSCEPFAYASNMQHGRLLDLSWTEDGRCVIISAEEGYCTFVRFEDSELGIPLKTIPRPPPPPELVAPPPPSPPSPVPPPPLPIPAVLQSPNTPLEKWIKKSK